MPIYKIVLNGSDNDKIELESGTDRIYLKSSGFTSSSLYISNGGISTTTNTSNIDLSYPSDLISGEILVAVISTKVSAAWYSKTGWQSMGTVNNSSLSVNWLYRVSDGTESGTDNFSCTSTGNMAGVIYKYTSSGGYNVSKTPNVSTNNSITYSRVIPTNKYDIHFIVTGVNESVVGSGDTDLVHDSSITTSSGGGWSFSAFSLKGDNTSKTTYYNWTTSSIYSLYDELYAS